MCEPLSPPKNGHDWFCDAKDHIGVRELARIWGRSEAHCYRWTRDPEAKAKKNIDNDASPNPIYRIQETLRELSKHNPPIAKMLAESLIEIIGSSIPCKSQITPDKETLAEELLDDLPHVVAFHQAMMEGKHPGVTGALCAMAKRELDEDQQMYLMQFEDKPARKVRLA